MMRKHPEFKLVEELEPTCRVCGSKEVTKASTRVDLKNQLVSRRYTCKKCGATFTAGKRRYNKTPAHVQDFAVYLVLERNMTLNDAAALSERAFGIKVRDPGVWAWVHKAAPGIRLWKGRKLVGPKKTAAFYYKPTRKRADKATVRGIRSLMKQIDEKLQTFEKRAERVP